MEQNYTKSGLNLNPMYFWKFVRMDKNRSKPRIVCMLDRQDEVLALANENHVWDFVFVVGQEWLDPLLPNVKLIWGDTLQGESLYRLFASADYVLTNDPETQLIAMFCGAGVADNENLEEIVKNTQPLTVVERIENWEKAENILT